MEIIALALALGLAACGSKEEEPAATTNAPPVELSERPGPAPSEPTPAEPPAEPPAADADAAVTAYEQALTAYNERNADGYFAAFAETLTCFHGTANVTAGDLRTRREPELTTTPRAWLRSTSVDVARSSADEVVLVDRGAWWMYLGGDEVPRGSNPIEQTSSDPYRMGTHEKIVVMRLVGGEWKIAAETALAAPGCLPPEVTAGTTPSGDIARCRTANEACMQECTGACVEASNGCNMCPGSCANALADCLGIADLEFDSAL